MRFRKLGRSDLELSVVGFGAASIGAGKAYAFASRDEAESIATIYRALDLGINWIDTAPLYGSGAAERMVGKATAGMSGVIIATKCGPDGENPSSLKRDHIRGQAEESLRRLGVEAIDLYQIHWPRPEEEIEEGWHAVAELVREGKVRYAGVSNFSVDQLRMAESIHPVTSLQPSYSMLRRDIEAEILPYCREREIGIVAYSPMQSGLLTGRFTREHIGGLPEGDWRLNQREFKEPALSGNLAFIERLGAVSERTGRTLSHIAIAWVLRLPEVTAAIVGARNPAQIEETAGAADVVLDGPLLEEIETAYRRTVTG